jgi:hypothetical protein
MPSLFQDPSSALAVPITGERIMLTIRDPLQRLHNQQVPSWYQGIEGAIRKLVELGMKISVYPQAFEIQNKLHTLADAVLPLEGVNSIINNQLIRNMRDVASQRCDNGHLSLFLALVDGWLRSCEEYARRKSISALQTISRDSRMLIESLLRSQIPTLPIKPTSSKISSICSTI